MRGLILFSMALAAAAQSVEVRHDDVLCLTYYARLDGPYLAVRVRVEPVWHTFAMDNKQRAEEKLAGKPALSVDRATEITLVGGLEAIAPWYQSPPTDFSRPQLRWFSWGFDHEAVFVTKVRHSSAAPTRIAIRGQACTESICKNIETSIILSSKPGRDGNEIDLKTLVPVR